MLQEVANFNKILTDFKIKANCSSYIKEGDSCSYFLNLEPSVKLKTVTKFGNELAMALKAQSAPNFNCDFSSGTLRVDFISKKSNSVNLHEILTKESPPKEMQIPVFLGKDYYGKNVWMDVEDNPHMIVAGSTGSGKTVALHTIIGNLIFQNKYEIHLIDPKGFEFSKYQNVNGVKFYSSYQDSVELIEEMIENMEIIFSFMNSGLDKNYFKPKIIIIDEYSDLIMQDRDKKLYKSLCALAQKCRAARIHIILATQRPSSNLLDGNIKANFPGRLACKVSSKIDSKIIIDSSGAEELLGKGDSILVNSSNKKTNLKIAFSCVEENITNAARKYKKINH